MNVTLLHLLRSSSLMTFSVWLFFYFLLNNHLKPCFLTIVGTYFFKLTFLFSIIVKTNYSQTNAYEPCNVLFLMIASFTARLDWIIFLLLMILAKIGKSKMVPSPIWLLCLLGMYRATEDWMTMSPSPCGLSMACLEFAHITCFRVVGLLTWWLAPKRRKWKSLNLLMDTRICIACLLSHSIEQIQSHQNDFKGKINRLHFFCFEE